MSPGCPYIFEVLLLQYREEEPSHNIVIVGRHDDNVNGECSDDESVGGPTKEEREVLPTVEEKGALVQFELHGVLLAPLEGPPAQDLTQFE